MLRLFLLSVFEMDIAQQTEETMKGTTVGNCRIWEWEFLKPYRKSGDSTIPSTQPAITVAACQSLCSDTKGCLTVSLQGSGSAGVFYSIGCTLTTAALSEKMGASASYIMSTKSTCYGKSKQLIIKI